MVGGMSGLGMLVPSFAAAKSGGVTPGDVAIDQGYLIAARQEEMSHYALEKSATGKPSPFTTFCYPPNMFSDAQTTLDVLVTLEDAFIAALGPSAQALGHDDHVIVPVAQRVVERDHRIVLGADHEVDLGHVARGQPRLARAHHRPPMTAAALIGTDREVVDPAAVPVVADHRRGHELVTAVAGQDR
jgi:hypothetical protein